MMIKRSNSVVLLGILSFGVSACGQNPNVNSHYFAPIAQNGTAVNAPAPAPSQAQGQPSVPVLDTGGKSVIPKQDDSPAPPLTTVNMGGNQLPNLPAPQLPKIIQIIDPNQKGIIQRPDNSPAPALTGVNMGGNQLPNLPDAPLPKIIQIIDPNQKGIIQRPDNSPAPALTGVNMGGNQLPNLPDAPLPKIIEIIDPHQKGIIPREDDTPPPLPAQLTGLSGDPLPNLPPATLPIVVLAPQNPDPGSPNSGSGGQDGKPGQNGQDGKPGQNGQNGKDDCGVRAFTLQFPARPFTDAEKILYSKELPYRSTTGYPVAEHLNHKIPTIQLGEMTGMNDGIPFVANSQIEMAIDVAIPGADAVVQIQDLTLRMYVSKLSQEKYIDTEMLCFLDEKLCSGEVFQASNWQKNINPSFFTNGKPANENFVRAYTERAVGSVPVYRNVKTADGTIKRELVKRDPVFASGISLPISDVVAGTGITASQLLYGQAGAKIASDSSSGLYERTLHIVVADDTYVREDAEVVVTLTADTCKMPNIELKAK